MGISVKIINVTREENSESRAAEFLKACIEKSIPAEAIGEIHIITGVNIPFGKVSDIDILLVVNIANCTITIDGTDVDVESFCTTIELKEQTVDNVFATTTDVYVNYPSTNIRKNASEQNRNQKYTLLKYCQQFNHPNLFISNILWLKSVSVEEWNGKGWYMNTPVLLSLFEFNDIVKQVIKSGHKIYNGAIAVRNNDTDSLNRLIKDLTVARPVPPRQLRDKIELLVANQLEDNVNTIIDQNSFCCIDGKAGTGKTFLLLRTALSQAAEGYSCALLTYNKALCLDLQRLVSFIRATSDARGNLEICTLHSFISSLAKKIGWQRDHNTEECLEYARMLRRSLNDKTLYETNLYDLVDFVFIDEAQDCTPYEKEILEIVFGEDRIVVAKSALQKIRRVNAAHWGIPTIKLMQGLRQKSNIVNFLKILTSKMGIGETCAGPNSIINGGKVIITPSYTTDIHTDLEKNCLSAGCSNYDILILIPPTMVKDQQFVNAKLWRDVGKINLIDGCNTSALETCTQTELINSCRVYQYESCRGLEGWATVCYNLDEIIKYKYNDAKIENIIGDPEKLKMQEAYQWIMMPLTRAIDTLVITVNDTNSSIANILREAAAQCADFVDCRI